MLQINLHEICNTLGERHLGEVTLQGSTSVGLEASAPALSRRPVAPSCLRHIKMLTLRHPEGLIGSREPVPFVWSFIERLTEQRNKF